LRFSWKWACFVSVVVVVRLLPVSCFCLRAWLLKIFCHGEHFPSEHNPSKIPFLCRIRSDYAPM
jgi:hypothetical protein